MKKINPIPDFSWVPDGLKSFTKGTLGTLLIILVGLFVVFSFLMIISHVTSNHFTRKLTYETGLLSTVIAASLIASLGGLANWGLTHIQAVPNGVEVYEPHIKDISTKKKPHEITFKNARRELQQMSKAAQKGNLLGAGIHGFTGVGKIIQGTQENVINGEKDSISDIKKNGIPATIKQGFNSVQKTTRKIASRLGTF